MKGVGNLIAVVGILLFIYSVVARFLGGPTIGLGIITAMPQSGVITANAIMLTALVIKLWDK